MGGGNHKRGHGGDDWQGQRAEGGRHSLRLTKDWAVEEVGIF